MTESVLCQLYSCANLHTEQRVSGLVRSVIADPDNVLRFFCADRLHVAASLRLVLDHYLQLFKMNRGRI